MILAALAAVPAALAAGALVLSRRVERRYPPVGRFVNTSGPRLHVVDSGGDGPAVLLIHGASGNFADPHGALAAPLIARGFRVLAVDRPGHGYSGRRAGAAEPSAQALWIVEAAQKLGVTQAIVVVHSLAGVLGLAMALERPGFVRGLVLLSAVSHPWPGGVAWYNHVAAAPFIGPVFNWIVAPYAVQAMTGAGVRAVFAPNTPPPGYAELTRLALLLRPWQFRANAEDLVALFDATRRQAMRYGEIAAPTAVVMGLEDGVVSPDIHARACGREIPGARLWLLPGIGHSPHYAAGQDVLAAIEDVAQRAAARETVNEQA